MSGKAKDMFGGNKAIKNLLDIGIVTGDGMEFLAVKIPIDGLYKKIKDGTATTSDKEVVRLLEEHSDMLLKLLTAIAKAPRR